jgi:hypothetical protein
LSPVDYRGALEAVERVLNRGGEPPEVLTAVLEALAARGVTYGAIRSGGDEVVLGAPGGPVVSKPIVAGDGGRGTLTLAVDDEAFVERVATLISPYVSRVAL